MIVKKLCVACIAVAVLATLCVSAAPALAASAGFHYLAADPSLRAQTQNVNVTMGQATYVGKMVEVDQPWESPFKLCYPGSVVIDPATGQWRMYYELMKSETERFVAMATSADGVHWTKPALNITGVKYTTDQHNNIVNNTSSQWIHGPSVSVDPHAPADQRYRMTADVYNGDVVTLTAYSSADGLNWRQAGTIQTADWSKGFRALDAENTAFWDPTTQKYMAQMRYNYPVAGGPRGVMMKLNNTWDGTWSADPQFTINPDDAFGTAAGRPDIYCPDVVPYFGQYVGLPAMYYHTNDSLYPTFMYSRDAAHWSFPDYNKPVIDLGAHGRNQDNFGMAYPANSLIDKDGWLYIYYSWFPEKHSQDIVSGQMHLAKMREDRFVGIKSTPGSVGTWTTSAITLTDDPGRLIINAIVRGSLRVEVLDSLTLQPLAGYELSKAASMAPGDYLGALARWTGADSLNSLAGRTVALRFVMDDATVYSFHFESAPEPSSFILSVPGLIGMLIYTRLRRL
jgi:hypothetical protein